jgi:NAD(P)-dependent dehydrogenase (short-subunit alcohol dehydrogenase family)
MAIDFLLNKGCSTTRINMKRIVVTGCTSGFGLLTVQALAKRGHTVYATMRNIRSRNAEVANGLRHWAMTNNVDIRIVELDVTSDMSVEKAVAQIVYDAGQIDVLINNAGVLVWGLSETLSTRQMEQIFQVNVFGAYRMNKAVLPYMHRRNSGLLIQLSSGLSRLHLPCLGAYSATKAAVDTMAEILHYELSKTGIDSIIIQPGPYPATDLFNKLIPADSSLVTKHHGEFESRMKQCIRNLFTQTRECREPGEVAHLIAEIVDAPRDRRRLWTTIGMGVGEVYIDAINENTHQFSQRVQHLLGIQS